MCHSEINLLTPLKVFYVQLALGTWNIYTPFAVRHESCRSSYLHFYSGAISFTQVVSQVLIWPRCVLLLVGGSPHHSAKGKADIFL